MLPGVLWTLQVTMLPGVLWTLQVTISVAWCIVDFTSNNVAAVT